jgi:hypothetical protein
MHGSNFATMDKPLERSRMDFEHGRRLMTVEQRLAVDTGAAIGCSCAYWWFSFVGHGDSSLQANPCPLVYKRGSRSEGKSSNENLGERHSFLE